MYSTQQYSSKDIPVDSNLFGYVYFIYPGLNLFLSSSFPIMTMKRPLDCSDAFFFTSMNKTTPV